MGNTLRPRTGKSASPYNLPGSYVLASTRLFFTWRGMSSVQKHQPQLLSSENPGWRRLGHHPIHHTWHTSALTRVYTDHSKQWGMEGRYRMVAGSHPSCMAPFHPSWTRICDIAKTTFVINCANPKIVSPVKGLHRNPPPASKLASSDWQMQSEIH